MSDRRWFLAAASAALLFACYGSLVPFVVDEQVRWHDALARARALSLDLPLAARSGDLIVNLLLLAPVGFFAAAAAGGARPAVAAVALLCLGVACALEFAQLFMVYRTASLSDVVALTAGGVSGAGLGAVFDGRIQGWRRAAATLTPGQRLRVLVWIYSAGWIVVGLLPLLFPDRAYPLPRAIWRRPAPPEYFSTQLAGGILTALAVVPLGVAAAWVARGSRRLEPVALLAAVALVVWLDALRQITPGGIDPSVVWRSAGVVLGFTAALTPWAQRLAMWGVPRGRWAGYALGVWLIYVVLAAWAPFDFGVDAAGLSARIDLIYERVPLHRYYWAPPLTALRMLGTLVLAGAVCGALARLACRSRTSLVLVLTAAIVVFVGVEVGQFHLPGHRPDPTDVLALTGGMLAGSRIVLAVATARG